MAKKSFEVPNLDNATPEMIIDEMGKLSMVENAAKKMRAFYKEALYARTGIDPDKIISEPIINSGEMFIATTTQSYPNRLDQTAFKEAEPETFEKYVKQGQQLTTRFTLREGVDNPVVQSLIDQIKAELDLD